MSQPSALVAKRVSYLFRSRVAPRALAQVKHVSQDESIAKALDILFRLTELLDSESERQGWSMLSREWLERVWDNDLDAEYDNWRHLYAVPAR